MALEHLGWMKWWRERSSESNAKVAWRLLRLGERREKITRGGGHHLDGLPALSVCRVTVPLRPRTTASNAILDRFIDSS